MNEKNRLKPQNQIEKKEEEKIEKSLKIKNIGLFTKICKENLIGLNALANLLIDFGMHVYFTKKDENYQISNTFKTLKKKAESLGNNPYSMFVLSHEFMSAFIKTEAYNKLNNTLDQSNSCNKNLSQILLHLVKKAINTAEFEVDIINYLDSEEE